MGMASGRHHPGPADRPHRPRGHGRSDHAPGTYGVARYGADVVAVLHELGSRQAVLVGNSLGGVVSWWVAQNHPELVAAALLEDPPLLAGETPEAEAGRFRDVFHTVKANILDHREGGHSEEDMAERLGAMSWGPPGRRRSASSSRTTRSQPSPSGTAAWTSA